MGCFLWQCTFQASCHLWQPQRCCLPRPGTGTRTSAFYGSTWTRFDLPTRQCQTPHSNFDKEFPSECGSQRHGLAVKVSRPQSHLTRLGCSWQKSAHSPEPTTEFARSWHHFAATMASSSQSCVHKHHKVHMRRRCVAVVNAHGGHTRN